MKKILVFGCILLFLICGCGKKSNESSNSVINNYDGGSIEFETFHNYLLSNDEEYIQKLPVINAKTSDADNVNLELKSKLTINNKKALIDEEKYTKLNYSDYSLFESNKIVSLLSLNYLYYNGTKELIDLNAYSFYSDSYKYLSNEDLLEFFEISESEMFDKILNNSDFDSPEYEVMMIKNKGYVLVVENDNLVIYFIEHIDEESQLKRMVII